MARATNGLAFVAAAAIIGGLAWWLLGSGGGSDTGREEEKYKREIAFTSGRLTKTAENGAKARPGPAALVGTLMAVVKGEGKPLAATLVAVPAADVHAEAASATGSAADGTVRLETAPAGVKLRVTIAAAGWRSLVLPDVEVAVGAEKDLGELTMERALPATGRVLDPSGKPVAGATVGALTPDAMARFDFRRLADLILNEPDWKAKATTREDGTFSLDALGPGTWNLVATATGFSPSSEKNVLLHPAGTAPPVDLVLQQGHSLVVKVTGAGDAPLAGAEASAASTGNRAGLPVSMGPARGLTDSGGEAHLSGIAPGRTAVAIRAADGRLVVRTVDVPSATIVNVKMEGAATLVVKVRTSEGGPVDGATVLAMLQSGSGGMDSGEMLSGTTGTDGNAKWEHLAAGSLAFVLVEKAGFPPVTPEGGGGGGRGQDPLKDGETLEKEIVLKAGAVVSGVVRRRPGENAVPGAFVSASASGNFFGGQPLRATADAEGAYRIEGVPEGRVSISAAAEGFAPPEAWTVGGGMLMPQQEGQTPPEGVVVVAPGATEVKKDLYIEETGTVTGRVLGPTGEGLGGARVEISAAQGFNRGFGFGGGGTEHLPGPVLTSPDGAFLVKGVPAGQNLTARAEYPGLIAGTSSPFALAVGGAAPAVEVRMTEGGVLAGRVTTGTGAPVAGAKVRASSRQPRPGGRMMNMGGMPGNLEAVSAADGTWRIATVPPGPVSMSVEAEGYIDANRSDLVVAAGTETRADVSLESGRTIAGTVKDSTGAPVEGARVMARSAEGTAPEAMRFKNVTTDAGGAFRITGLPAGNFIISVNAPRNAARTIPEVASGTETMDIRLLPAVRMTGKVVDSAGNAVAGARVNAASEAGDGVNGNGRSGPDGTFEVDSLVAGTYKVTAQTFDRKYGRAESKGVAGDATGVVLTLPLALEIKGKVLGADGGPPPERGTIWVTDAAGMAQGIRARWEEDGSFTLGGLTEGSFTLRALIPGKFEGTVTALAGITGVTIRLEVSTNQGPGGGGSVPVGLPPAGTRGPR